MCENNIQFFIVNAEKKIEKKYVETPLMKQYYSIKAVHPDAILLFRVGDFYETFGEDAIKASGILGITLTRRANGSATYVELAGFPYHAIDTYLPKLVRAGERVAICEQLEDPKLVKGLVKRGVIELVTPGIVLGDNILANKENNFIASVYFGRQTTGVAFLDISTGEFYVAEGADSYVDKLISNLQPKEVVYQRGYEDRFSGSFDFFTRRSKDLLYSRPIAPSLGYGSIDENVGALKNTGIEMVLNGTIINQNGWVWKLGMNLTHYKNKVTDLPLKDMPRSGVNKLQVGRSVYDFYMIEWAGVDPENGDPLWYMDEKDANKNPTGRRVTTNDYSSADYYYVNKSSLPKVYGGFNTSLSWKGFDLSAIFAYSIGGYIYNRDITMILHNGSLEGRDWSTEILRRWTPDNRYTDVPALSTTSNNWNSASTRFLQNNSYMRLKNLTLSYNLPKQWISKLSLSSVQVYVQGDNLFTIHRNQGLDPEQGITGITYYRYPAMRTISGGINVSF